MVSFARMSEETKKDNNFGSHLMSVIETLSALKDGKDLGPHTNPNAFWNGTKNIIDVARGLKEDERYPSGLSLKNIPSSIYSSAPISKALANLGINKDNPDNVDTLEYVASTILSSKGVMPASLERAKLLSEGKGVRADPTQANEIYYRLINSTSDKAIAKEAYNGLNQNIVSGRGRPAWMNQDDAFEYSQYLNDRAKDSGVFQGTSETSLPGYEAVKSSGIPADAYKKRGLNPNRDYTFDQLEDIYKVKTPPKKAFPVTGKGNGNELPPAANDIPAETPRSAFKTIDELHKNRGNLGALKEEEIENIKRLEEAEKNVQEVESKISESGGNERLKQDADVAKAHLILAQKKLSLTRTLMSEQDPKARNVSFNAPYTLPRGKVRDGSEDHQNLKNYISEQLKTANGRNIPDADRAEAFYNMAEAAKRSPVPHAKKSEAYAALQARALGYPYPQNRTVERDFKKYEELRPDLDPIELKETGGHNFNAPYDLLNGEQPNPENPEHVSYLNRSREIKDRINRIKEANRTQALMRGERLTADALANNNNEPSPYDLEPEDDRSSNSSSTSASSASSAGTSLGGQDDFNAGFANASAPAPSGATQSPNVPPSVSTEHARNPIEEDKKQGPNEDYRAYTHRLARMAAVSELENPPAPYDDKRVAAYTPEELTAVKQLKKHLENRPQAKTEQELKGFFSKEKNKSSIPKSAQKLYNKASRLSTDENALSGYRNSYTTNIMQDQRKKFYERLDDQLKDIDKYYSAHGIFQSPARLKNRDKIKKDADEAWLQHEHRLLKDREDDAFGKFSKEQDRLKGLAGDQVDKRQSERALNMQYANSLGSLMNQSENSRLRNIENLRLYGEGKRMHNQGELNANKQTYDEAYAIRQNNLNRLINLSNNTEMPIVKPFEHSPPEAPIPGRSMATNLGAMGSGISDLLSQQRTNDSNLSLADAQRRKYEAEIAKMAAPTAPAGSADGGPIKRAEGGVVDNLLSDMKKNLYQDALNNKGQMIERRKNFNPFNSFMSGTGRALLERKDGDVGFSSLPGVLAKGFDKADSAGKELEGYQDKSNAIDKAINNTLLQVSKEMEDKKFKREKMGQDDRHHANNMSLKRMEFDLKSREIDGKGDREELRSLKTDINKSLPEVRRAETDLKRLNKLKGDIKEKGYNWWGNENLINFKKDAGLVSTKHRPTLTGKIDDDLQIIDQQIQDANETIRKHNDLKEVYQGLLNPNSSQKKNEEVGQEANTGNPPVPKVKTPEATKQPEVENTNPIDNLIGNLEDAYKRVSKSGFGQSLGEFAKGSAQVLNTALGGYLDPHLPKEDRFKTQLENSAKKGSKASEESGNKIIGKGTEVFDAVSKTIFDPLSKLVAPIGYVLNNIPGVGWALEKVGKGIEKGGEAVGSGLKSLTGSESAGDALNEATQHIAGFFGPGIVGKIVKGTNIIPLSKEVIKNAAVQIGKVDVGLYDKMKGAGLKPTLNQVTESPLIKKMYDLIENYGQKASRFRSVTKMNDHNMETVKKMLPESKAENVSKTESGKAVQSGQQRHMDTIKTKGDSYLDTIYQSLDEGKGKGKTKPTAENPYSSDTLNRLSPEELKELKITPKDPGIPINISEITNLYDGLSSNNPIKSVVKDFLKDVKLADGFISFDKAKSFRSDLNMLVKNNPNLLANSIKPFTNATNKAIETTLKKSPKAMEAWKNYNETYRTANKEIPNYKNMKEDLFDMGAKNEPKSLFNDVTKEFVDNPEMAKYRVSKLNTQEAAKLSEGVIHELGFNPSKGNFDFIEYNKRFKALDPESRAAVDNLFQKANPGSKYNLKEISDFIKVLEPDIKNFTKDPNLSNVISGAKSLSAGLVGTLIGAGGVVLLPGALKAISVLALSRAGARSVFARPEWFMKSKSIKTQSQFMNYVKEGVSKGLLPAGLESQISNRIKKDEKD